MHFWTRIGVREALGFITLLMWDLTYTKDFQDLFYEGASMLNSFDERKEILHSTHVSFPSEYIFK